MVCRHSPGDRDCTTQFPVFKETYSYYPENVTPDKKNYEVADVYEQYPFLILSVKYPNCNKCSFEGKKTIVFKDVRAVDALKWKEIDPHFRNPDLKLAPNVAPSPVARFPGSSDGWKAAISYVKTFNPNQK